MNIVIRIDVEEATEPVHVLVKSTSELVQFQAKRTSNEPELLVQNGDPSTSTSTTSTNLEPSTSNSSTNTSLVPMWRNENNGKCTSTNCLRPLYTKTLCQACYKKLKRATYAPSDEALACVAEWTEVVASPPSIRQQKAGAKPVEEMVRIDKRTWDEIAAINSHALRNWVPNGFIKSPTKYRRRSRSYPEMWTWEVIKGEMQNGFNQRSSQANDPLQGIDLSEA